MPLTAVERTGGSLHLEWRLGAPRADAWRHLTDLRSLPAWLGTPVTGDLRPGATLVVDHGEGYRCTSDVATVEAGTRLTMSWRFPDEHDTELEIVLRDHDDGCVLALAHLGLGELVAGYEPGWIVHLTYFEASLGGSPLPMRGFWDLYATIERLVPGRVGDDDVS